jgi:hypothetical protein
MLQNFFGTLPQICALTQSCLRKIPSTYRNLWCFHDNWEWSSGRSSRKKPEFPSWMTIQSVFSQSELGFFQSSQLSWTHWSLRFPSSEVTVLLNVAEVMLNWQHGQCWMCILLSLENTLKPRLGPHTNPYAPYFSLAAPPLQEALS